MKAVFTLFLAAFTVSAFGQAKDFPFGATLREASMTTYSADTSANAVVLNESGRCSFDEASGNIEFIYHVRIKILKQEGAELATIEIPVYKRGTAAEDREIVKGIKASVYNIENHSLKETKMDNKSVFTQDLDQNWTLHKFAIPNVRAGSVIEYTYTIMTPFVFKFRNWEFQSEIPKQKSTYYTSIPGNYHYNITLKGFLKLADHDQKITKDCFRMNGGSADCVETKFEMVNIPAFKAEEYISARSNYLSALNFELSEVKTFDGRTIKYTKEWKDTDLELKNDEDFGLQLKRGGNALEDAVEKSVAGVTDPLKKAMKIFDMVKFHYQWDGTYTKYSKSIKRAFDAGKGSVGDINLTLIAALREAKLPVEPVILSTRAHGLPIELHPVLTDFNYVIAKVTLGEKVYLLDATEDLIPFGTLPVRCLNGKGRVLADGESYWLPLTPTQKDRKVSMINLSLGNDGTMKGKVTNMYFGYAAIQKRSEVLSADKEQYVNKMRSTLAGEIVNHAFVNFDSLDKPLTESFELELDVFEGGLADNLLFNPFILWKTSENPFKANERLYPVDFGVPQEENITVSLDFPDTHTLTSVPEQIALILPGNGGRYMFAATVTGHKVTINNLLSIARPVYTSEEYHYLKELYTRLIQAQSTDLILRKKT